MADVKTQIAEIDEILKNDYVPEKVKIALRKKRESLTDQVSVETVAKTETKPEQKKPTSKRPVRLSQLKKWFEKNKGETIYLVSRNGELVNQPRKIHAVQTLNFSFKTNDDKEVWANWPKAKELKFEGPAFAFNGLVYSFDKLSDDEAREVIKSFTPEPKKTESKKPHYALVGVSDNDMHKRVILDPQTKKRLFPNEFYTTSDAIKFIESKGLVDVTKGSMPLEKVDKPKKKPVKPSKQTDQIEVGDIVVPKQTGFPALEVKETKRTLAIVKDHKGNQYTQRLDTLRKATQNMVNEYLEKAYNQDARKKHPLYKPTPEPKKTEPKTDQKKTIKGKYIEIDRFTWDNPSEPYIILVEQKGSDGKSFYAIYHTNKDRTKFNWLGQADTLKEGRDIFENQRKKYSSAKASKPLYKEGEKINLNDGSVIKIIEINKDNNSRIRNFNYQLTEKDGFTYESNLDPIAFQKLIDTKNQKQKKTDLTPTEKKLVKKAGKKPTKTTKNIVVIDGEEYDCDDLIERRLKQQAKKKAYNKEQSKKRESTKNKERMDKVAKNVIKSIQERLDDGKPVSKTEINKLIQECDDLLKKLIDYLKTEYK